MAAVCVCAYETCQQQQKNFGLGKVKSQNSVIRKNNIYNIYLFWVEDNISIYFLGTGMDRVFLGLAMLLPEVFQGQIPEENPEEQPCQPKENPVHPNSFNRIYSLSKTGHFGDFLNFSNIDV